MLEDRLIAQIRASGPMSIADFMSACLLDPSEGYYTTHPPFGTDGDFVTAPEIHQMFGEMLGLALAQSWLDQGVPDPFVLAELGPGRGTLMADALRAIGVVPGLSQAARICLVEASPALRDDQRKTLADHDVEWVDRIGDLPQGPLFLLANEFFDALPIRQFQRNGDGWRERTVGVIDGRLGFGHAPQRSVPELAHRLADTRDGDIVETCKPAQAIAAEVGARIARHGGVAIIVDYGDRRSLGDTFQAVRDHSYVDPITAPGHADLTAHVDFGALAQAMAPANVTTMATQREFLGRLGIGTRAEVLSRNLSPGDMADLETAFQRLTGEDQMGTLFKALAAYPKGCPVPPGFS